MYWSKEEQCYLSRGAAMSKLNWLFIIKVSDVLNFKKRINIVWSEARILLREICHMAFHNLMGSHLAGKHFWGQRIHNIAQMQIQETYNKPWPKISRAFVDLTKRTPNLLKPSFGSSQIYYLPYNSTVAGRVKMCTKFRVLEWKAVNSLKHPTCSKLFKLITEAREVGRFWSDWWQKKL